MNHKIIRLGRRIFGTAMRLAVLPSVFEVRLAAAPAAGQSPIEYCRSVGTDDVLRPPPPALAEALRRAFGVTGTYALETSFYRCDRGAVMLCTVGANLVCGKANTSTSLPAANGWCRENPNSDFIPLAVTGHDTIYEWICEGAKAVPGRKSSTVDDRGFISENWKKLP
jgi:hypothetical protein